MDSPLISVIVPVYNTEKYIRKCIASILNQTFHNIELILVDDGSADNCGAICDEYAEKDNRVRVFHQENQGVCVARNVGIENATGEYISFVDSDDYLRKNALEILYNDLEEYNADISCAGGKSSATLQETSCVVWKEKEALKESLLDNAHTRSACRKLYKRAFVGEIRFENGRKVNEDGFFVFCCFLKCPTVVVRNIGIYGYVHNTDSASSANFSEAFFDILYFADKKKEMTVSQFPELESEINSMLLKANLMMLGVLCKADGKQYRDEIKKSISTVKKLKKYFVPTMPSDKKFFFIVTNNLYSVYRIYYKFKNKRK